MEHPIMTPYIFQRGETITLALDAVSGDPAGVTAISAQLKAVPPGRTSVPVGAAIAASFSVTSHAAMGEIPAGWTLTISSAASAALPAGAYLADARLDVAGGVVISESVALRLRPSVTT
jgi:hypothetical protein